MSGAAGTSIVWSGAMASGVLRLARCSSIGPPRLAVQSYKGIRPAHGTEATCRIIGRCEFRRVTPLPWRSRQVAHEGESERDAHRHGMALGVTTRSANRNRVVDVHAHIGRTVAMNMTQS